MDTKLYYNFKEIMFKIKTPKQIQDRPPLETNYWDKIKKKNQNLQLYTPT